MGLSDATPADANGPTRRRWLRVVGAGAVATAGCLYQGRQREGGDCAETDRDAPLEIDAVPGWDEPPQAIDRPEKREGSWDEHYLGVCMAREPSLSFEVLQSVGRAVVPSPPHEGYWIGLATTAAEAEDLLGDLTPEVDFDETLLVVVQSPGSGSFRHRWARVEPIDAGVHLHGYYERPHSPSRSSSMLESIVRIDRPSETIDLARVSLTITQEVRLHFDTAVSPVESGDFDF